MTYKQQSLNQRKIKKGPVTIENLEIAITICKICCKEYAIKVKKCLAIPASSVPSEQVFSLIDNLVNKKRARFSPSNIDNMI